MATPSSILKGAATAQAKAQQFDDSLAAYDYETSAKTYADYTAYEDYLSGRVSAATDPGTQLSYQKKLDSARSAYISNEIQRQSINVIEGNTSNVDKYNRMLDLYYAANDSGQADLAQSMRLQLDNLSVTIQNEQKAALAADKQAASEASQSIDNQVNDAVQQIKDNAKYALEQYSALGSDQFMAATGSDIFSMLANMVNSQDPNNPGLVQIYDMAQKATPDPAKERAYQVKLHDYANGGSTDISLPGVGNVSYKDLIDQANAQSTGQTLFDTVDTGNGIEFTRNKTTGYAWGRDENGNYKLMPIYNPNQNFTSGVKDPTQKNANLSYENLLKSAGFEITKGGDQLTIRNNGQLDSAGIPRGQQVRVYVDRSGNLQVVNGNGAYNLGFDMNTGKYTGIQAQGANPINLFGDQFNNRFFAGQDLSNQPAGAIGTIDTTSPIARGMEAGPLAKPQPILQSNALYHQAPSGTPQAAGLTGNIQSAVSPLGLPGNITLQIAQPQPLPKITVATTKPLPNLTVTQAKPQQGLSVAAPQATPRIKI